jgi:hypothetical protein
MPDARVTLTLELPQAFLDLCKRDGASPESVLRDFMAVVGDEPAAWQSLLLIRTPPRAESRGLMRKRLDRAGAAIRAISPDLERPEVLLAVGPEGQAVCAQLARDARALVGVSLHAKGAIGSAEDLAIESAEVFAGGVHFRAHFQRPMTPEERERFDRGDRGKWIRRDR